MVVTIGPGEVLANSVAEGDVPGVVALAADDNGLIYAGAFSERELGSGVEMTLDTVCWIASMTKAVTSVSAMQLVEQGRLSLDDPLARVLPRLGSVQVLEGFDAAGAPRLRAPKRPITLRHLLTHTAGFSYDIWNADIGRYVAHAGLPGIIECKDAALTTPLVCDPGERWEYGINLDYVGKAVEAVSGQSLANYMREHIFQPLGMSDSGFVIGAEQRTRLASVHVRNDHDPYPGMPIRWGLGFMITTETTPAGRSPGSVAWAGLANTYYWIDPTRR